MGANDVRIRFDVDTRSGEVNVQALGKKFDSVKKKGTGAARFVNKGMGRLKKTLSATSRLTARLTGSLGKLAAKAGKFSALFGAAGGGLALFAGKKMAEDIMDVGGAFESLGIRLETIQGSAEKAKQSLDWVEKFTATTPFELDQVSDAFTRLEAYGISATKWLPKLGDTAAGMGKDLNESVEMFADAIVGEFERLKSFGVKARTVGDQVTFSWNQNGKAMQLTADKTSDGISAALEKIFKRFEGGMLKQSKTWGGMLSNLADKWTGFRKSVADAGLFEYMKSGLASTLAKIKEWKKSGRLDTWAKQTSDAFIWVIEKGRNIGKTLIEWGGKAAGFLREKFMPVIDQVRDRVEIWYFRNEKLIKSKLADWAKKVGEGIKGMADWVKEIVENGDLARWADTAVKSFRIVFGWAEKIAKAFKWVGETIGKALANALNFYEEWDRKIGADKRNEIVFQAMMEGSTKKPFTEKLDELSHKFNRFTDDISRGAEFTVDATPFSGFMDSFSSLYEKQLARLMGAKGLAAASATDTGPYSYIQRGIAANEVRSAEAGMDVLLSEMRRMSAMTGPHVSGGGSTGTASAIMKTGDIHINVPPNAAPAQPEDWRYITRNYIIPELQAAGWGGN